MTEEQEDRIDAAYMKRARAQKNQKFTSLRDVLEKLWRKGAYRQSYIDLVATEGCKATISPKPTAGS